MRYKFELSVMTVIVCGLLPAGVASANSVTKTLYVDGVKVGTSTANQALSYPYPRLTIGAEGSRYFRYNGLVGQIDEFAVYDKVLNDANVAAHYSAGTGGYVAAVTADSPTLYLRFEDGSSSSGSKAANSGSAADMNITYIGAVTLTNSGYIGKAAVLSGATDGNGDCVDVCDYSLQLSTSNVSVEFWVKTTQSSDYPRLFQHNGGSTEERSYGAMYNAGTNAFGLIGGGGTGYLTHAINDGAWHHVVVTFQSLIPGPYAAEVLADNPCLYLKFDSLMPVDSSANHYWVGMGERAKIQKAGGIGMSLYADNTSANYSNGHAAADVFTWNNWYSDGIGRTRTGPPYGGNDDGYAFAPGDITFEIWIKSVPGLTSDQYGMIFQQVGAYTREPNAPALGLYSDAGVPKLRVAGGSQWFYPGTAAPLDGKWHQLVVTYDENEVDPGGSMGIQLYLDGSLAGQTTVYDPNGHQALLGPELSTIEITNEGDWGYPYNTFSGYIDEFAIYNGVLSAERIAAHYAAWQPKDCAEVQARGLLPGDFNGDCQVDLFDFVVLANQWRLSGGTW